MYNKIFTKILDSSIWLENQPTRIVWITFIACMDQDGVVALSSVGNVANRARVSVEEAEAAIKCLESPDIYNPDQDQEGRRIERIPGVGWIVLNSKKYRDIVKAETARLQTRERTREWRAKNKSEDGDADVTVCDENVTLSEAETLAQTKAESLFIVENSLNFSPSTTDLAWATKKCPIVDVALETEQWADHHLAKGTKIKDKTASWRTWMRNSQKWTTEKNKGVANARQQRTNTAIDEHSLIEGIRERVTNRQLQRVDAVSGE
jgi:hypothetical protein